MKKNLIATGMVGLGLALAGLGCGSGDSSPAPSGPAPTGAATATNAPAAAAAPAAPVVPGSVPVQDGIPVAIPPTSPLAKIKIGMDVAEVYNTIGQPTDQSAHITGKAFIPYYYGGDTHRLEAHYKGVGRIIFAPPHMFTSTMEVIEIDYDPTESGYAN